MKITKVIIRNFKKFKEETFNLDGNIVVAGPNNSGKTTLLQAIATWSLVLNRWCELNDFQRRGGKSITPGWRDADKSQQPDKSQPGDYTPAPIARHAFHSVSLRAFDLLWNERSSDDTIVIELTCDGTVVPVEIKSDSSEQVFVRPLGVVDPTWLQNRDNFPQPVFIPAMTGISTEEPVYKQPKINQLLGQGKPGDVLRNLLVETNYNQDAWEQLTESIKNMFDYELLPPNTDGPNIVAEYRYQPNGARYDIASAGSGFLQVLMLLTFLNSRKGTVLLLDEPDAHLHVILQDVIYFELQTTALKSGTQLIIATHSEVVINAVEPRELCALIGAPKKLADNTEKVSLITSLFALSNMDIMLAREKKNVLYVEGETDLNILRTWARILNHEIMDFLKQPFWKPTVTGSETRSHAKGIKAQDHFESLLLALEEIRGVQISDRDGNENMPSLKKTPDGKLLKLCWNRYEIESYLIHPAVLAKFVEKIIGENAPLAHIDAMKEVMRNHLPGAVVDAPGNDHSFLISTKARDILSNILEEANLQGFHYTRYFEIADTMTPDEIHPEVTEKLDAIADHFN